MWIVGSVGGRLRTQQQPCRWKRITFCGRYLCFSFTLMTDSGVLPSALHRGKKCGSCWLLVSRTKCGCYSSQKKELSPSSPKKKFFSKLSDKTSGTTGSSATTDVSCWHDMYRDPGPLASENSDQMIRFDLYFVSLVEKSAVPFGQKKVPKNPCKWALRSGLSHLIPEH